MNTCARAAPVYVEGRLKTRKWQDKEGRDTYTTEIIADQMQLLGGRDGGDEGGGGGGSYCRGAPMVTTTAAPPRCGPPGRAPSSPPRARPAPKASTGFDDMDDDIPF